MNPKTFSGLAVVAGICVTLTSCGFLTPAQQSEALQTVDAMVANGSITPAQAEGMKEAIMQSSTVAWWQQAAQVLLGGALGYVGVQMRRGTPATAAEKLARQTAKASGAK